MYVCMYVCKYIYIDMYIYICMCVYMYMYMSVCIYIYIYIHIHKCIMCNFRQAKHASREAGDDRRNHLQSGGMTCLRLPV